MREHEINKLDNFICGYYLDDTSICDKLIEYFKQDPNKRPGEIFAGIDLSWKDSTDSALVGPVAHEYIEHLGSAVAEYHKKYEFINENDPWAIIEPINIQHYKPKGGYFKWHCERSGSLFPISARHLVFMTYLNDVTDSGETEFLYQKIKIKPEKGLTLIWGTDWMFTHRGVPSETQEKYIVTGWWSYVSKPWHTK